MMEAVAEELDLSLPTGGTATLGRHRLILLDPLAGSNRFGDLPGLLEKAEYRGRLEIQVTSPDGRTWLLTRASARHLRGHDSLQQWLDAGALGAREV